MNGNGNGQPRILRDFFVYAANFSALAAAGVASTTIQVQADSDFELQKLAMFADVAAAAQTDSTRVLPLITIQITDQGSGRQIFQLPIPVPSVFGDGNFPFILPTTKLFVANSAIGIDLVNFSAATTYNLRIALIGAKIFRLSSAPTQLIR